MPVQNSPISLAQIYFLLSAPKRLTTDPVFVIMEWVNGGKLQSFLRKSRAEHYYGNLHGSSSHLTSRDLTSFAYQVARAMDYLTVKGVSTPDAQQVITST
jgi:serine/threonine protein kinase